MPRKIPVWSPRWLRPKWVVPVVDTTIITVMSLINRIRVTMETTTIAHPHEEVETTKQPIPVVPRVVPATLSLCCFV